MVGAQFRTDDKRWKAVVDNNSSADGTFYYAVKTTGVYCRPSCTSRLPNRTNIEYFEKCVDAEKAGYRACKRCKLKANSKRQGIEEKVVLACRIIENGETHLKLDELATRVNLSPYHFHRLFKKIVGVTPKQYASRHQSQRFQQNLKSSPSITDAIYSAGFSSSGSAYDRNQDQLAMKPKDYRSGAVGITISYGLAHCYLGWVIVVATDRGICAIEFGDDPDILPDQVQSRFPKAQLIKADIGFDSLIKEVVDFIKAPEDTFQLPLDIQGTAFQQRVWNVLRQIKPGKTLSYSDIASRIGNPSAVRAVASACGSNKIAVIIPCHRVIAKDGKVSGYRWGTERKKMLLESEKENVESNLKSQI